MNDTKEKILSASLKLFARDGYEAVSVSDISGQLDMTKGALYKHYKNKRDIFDCLVDRMDRRYAELFSGDVCDENEEPFVSPGLKAALRFCTTLFELWTGDEFASDFRKMLTLEQFRSDEMSTLYQHYFVSGPVETLTELLRDNYVPCSSEKAVLIYSSMFLFYGIYDGAADKLCTSFILKENIERLCFNQIG